MIAGRPVLSAVVVHWGDEAPLARLLATWPDDPRFELVLVRNSPRESDSPAISSPAAPPAGAGITVLEPERNLGFAGGVNLGLRHAAAPAVLLLNSDARPLPGALDALVDALARYPEAAGLVPALVDPAPGSEPANGVASRRSQHRSQYRSQHRSQHRWQLQPLPSALDLLLQIFFLRGRRGPAEPPAAGRAVEQPAAAALVLRRSALDAVGGLDAGFFPAWFEDVDLARRLANRGERLVYVPAARFVHDMGSSVPSLGYGAFLWIYLRHLLRYLGKHHGAAWATVARWLVPAACLLRILALPLRAPRRARGRLDAARSLLRVALGAVTGWRRPKDWAQRFRPQGEPGENSGRTQ